MSSKKFVTFVPALGAAHFAGYGRAIYHPSHEASTVSEPQSVFECMHTSGNCFAAAAGDSVHAGRAGAGGGTGDEPFSGSGGWFWRESRHEPRGEHKCCRGQGAGAAQNHGRDD
jgi:hypothetical protein